MKIRKALLKDAETIYELANFYANKALMLSRSRGAIYDSIRDFAVVEDDKGDVIACGALQVFWSDLAEVRTLAVKEDLKGKGIGKMIVDYLLQDARDLGIHRVFTLTYQPDFFKKCNFYEIDKEEMPHKVWKYCVNCPKFPNCDEICMVTVLE